MSASRSLLATIEVFFHGFGLKLRGRAATEVACQPYVDPFDDGSTVYVPIAFVRAVPENLTTAAPIEPFNHHMPVAAVARSGRPTVRPLALQLAVTAARNVRKGRQPFAQQVVGFKSTSPTRKRAHVGKSKVVAVSTRMKSAPRRRHVWLSSQSRVIRPVFANVVQINAISRAPRQSIRNFALKPTARSMRLAA